MDSRKFRVEIMLSSSGLKNKQSKQTGISEKETRPPLLFDLISTQNV
jgi:hypothetical protein